MSSILTNNSALVALQTLKSINGNLAKTQAEISTGKTVGSAEDNAAVWAISKTMETDQKSFETIQSNLNVAGQTVATARVGAEQIQSLLSDMQDLAIGANRSDADFGTIETAMTKKREQIAAIVAGTQANGVNLLSTNGINGGATYSVIGSLDRSGTTVTPSTIDVDSVDFEASIVGGTVTAITDQASAASALDDIKALMDTAIAGAAQLGQSGQRITDQVSFVSKLTDSLKMAVSSLVDADMEESSARLQALQTQQQLGIQALSIANQAPSSILSLFRG
ncbi:MAG TPA: flagellin [Paracoccus sp. (in: a-proteobacteria)]|uniref:flagellin N-terminal helical domain-containing protein n=1 Tax=Paracoccus sp. TaxID=267 RepID=UPI002B5F6B6D|nr:flagellin [Paracoccus sp. (in: a-proteobacteria)]HWL57261.1 flagellin [Paracoccus sp. (in: a-proteobacteria)]